MKSALVWFVLVLGLGVAGLWAQQNNAGSAPAPTVSVPRLVRFSGVLTDLTGKPLSGPVEAVFSVYQNESDAEPLWQETQTVEADAAGHYTVLLGAMSAQGLPMALFTSGEARWLGVAPGHLPEQPRVLLVSVPYALEAGDAATLGGKPASAYLLAQPAEGSALAESESDGTTTSGAAGSGSRPRSAAAGSEPRTVGDASSGADVYGIEGATSGMVFGVIGGTYSSTDSASGVHGGEGATTGKVAGVAGNVLNTPGPAVSFAPPAVFIGYEPLGINSGAHTVILTNTGDASLTIISYNIGGSNSADFSVSSNCPSSLAAGDSCDFSVYFNPTATGPRKSALIVNDDASNSPQWVMLTGVGSAAEVSPTALGFPSVAVGSSSNPQIVTIANNGSATMHIWQKAITGANAGDFSITASSCGATLTAGASCTVSVTFKPTAAGARTAWLLFSDDAGASPQAVSLSFLPPASVALTPGTPATGNLTANITCNLTFSFPANAVTAAATATLTPVASSNLPLALPSGTTFVCAFDLAVSPTISSFGAPVGLSGSVSPTIPHGTTLQLAMLEDPSTASSPSARARLRRTALQPMIGGTQVWVVVSTLVVGSNGSLTQNLPTSDLPGIVAPGDYVLFIPAPGTTIVSNFGVAVMGDDGMGSGNCAEALQVIHLYDVYGNPLATPTINCLSFPNAYDLDGTALTPDGSQGVMVDGGDTVRFFSGLQTGTVTASSITVDVSAYGGDGDSIAIMPNGNEAVVSADGDCPSVPCLVLVSGIVSLNPQPAIMITVPDNRDGVVISNDGVELLARGPSGLTVFAIAPVTPYTGSEGGTVYHSFTQVIDLPALGSQGYFEDGRDGMAISPVDSSRAVVVMPDGSIQLVTGLPSTPTLGASITPSVSGPMSVSITPDGKTAIVGGSDGVSMISGVDTGALAEVGTVYSPSYTANGSTVSLSDVATLAITLDGKYVAACDGDNSALVVIPISSSGFSAPVGVITGIAVPSNDQMVIH